MSSCLSPYCRRWVWAETVGVALGALAVFAWWDTFFGAGRTGDLMMLGLVVAAAYAVAVAVLERMVILSEESESA